MNVSERIIGHHVEYESQAYVYAFTIELEISAAAMWCFLSHLKPNVNRFFYFKFEEKQMIFVYLTFSNVVFRRKTNVDYSIDR